jgi:hypothetical protein
MLNKGETNMTHNLSQQANDKIDSYLSDWTDAYLTQIEMTYNTISKKDYLMLDSLELKWLRSQHADLIKFIIRERAGDDYENVLTSVKTRLIGEKKDNLLHRINKKGGSIKDVKNIELVADRLEGLFETEKGNVHLRTIYAGGYHIQTLHIRMICTLK